MRSEFGVEETHGILWRRQNRHHASSKGRGWNSVYAAVQDEAPYEAAFAGVPDHLLILHLGAPVNVARRIGGAQVEQTVPAGGVFFMPGNVEFWVRLGGELQTLHLYLRRQLLADVAGTLFLGDPDRIELPPVLGQMDGQIGRLALNIRDALEHPAAGDGLYADYLGRALATLLLRDANGARRAGDARDTRLRPAIRRAVDFMQDHLGEALQIEDLALASGLSPTHFTREFRRALGQPPHQFLLHRRILQAREMLARGMTPIVDIALDCGFASQEHFTRAFRAQTGTTPAAYRRISRQ